MTNARTSWAAVSSKSFPDVPRRPDATGVSNLRASLSAYSRPALPDTMAIQKYDIRRPDGVFEERYLEPHQLPGLGRTAGSNISSTASRT